MNDTNHEMFFGNSAAFITTSTSNRFSNSAKLYFNKRMSRPTTNTLFPELAVFHFIFKNTPTRCSLSWTNLGIYATAKLD